MKSSIQDTARDFLKDVFEAMDMTVVVDVKYDEIENSMEIELSGDDMGVLIGKRQNRRFWRVHGVRSVMLTPD